MRPGSRALLTLGLGTAVLFVLGLLYAWSLYATYLGLDRSEASYVFSTAMCLFCVGSLLSSLMTVHFPLRSVLIGAAALLLAGLAGLAFFAQHGFWALLAGFGICFGASCGIGYNAVVTSVNRWYPGRSGFASGILLLGFGMSALLLGTATHTLLNTLGWETTFLLIAITGSGLLVCYALRYRLPTPAAKGSEFRASTDVEGARDNLGAGSGEQETDKQAETPQAGINATAEGTSGRGCGTGAVGASGRGCGTGAVGASGREYGTGAESAEESPGLQVRDFLKADLFLFYVWRITLLGACITLVGSSSSEALALGANPGTASLLVGLVAASNGASRIVAGLVFDRCGIRTVMVMTTVLSLVGFLGVAISFAGGGLPLFIAAALTIGFAYGSLPVISATYSRVRFGDREYAVGLAVLNSNVAFGSFLSMAFVALLGSAGSSLGLYAALFAACGVALILLLLFLRTR